MKERLYLMPTLSCNCLCDYCYIPKKQRGKKGEQAFFKGVVSDFIKHCQEADIKIPQLRFSGGEPYCEPKLVELLSRIFLKSISSSLVIINTNGTLISLKILERLCLWKERLFHIVSLDGTKEIHDARRHHESGKSAFDKAVSGIKSLQSYGYPVYINMVLDQESIKGLDLFMDFLKQELALNHLSISLRHDPEKKVSVKHKIALLAKAYKLAQDKGLFLSGHHRLTLKEYIPSLCCQAGEKTVLVGADKRIYSCQRFVGKSSAYKYNGSECFKNTSVIQDISTTCYTTDDLELGRELYTLYKEKYNDYLAVNALDRILFGVIV